MEVDYLVSVHKWPFPAIPRLLRDRSASICDIACAAHTSTPPRNAADFLELAENCTFLDRKLTSALKEAVDGHYLALSAPFFKLLSRSGRDDTKDGNPIGPINSLYGQRHGASIFFRPESTRGPRINYPPPPKVNEFLKTEAACAIQS